MAAAFLSPELIDFQSSVRCLIADGQLNASCPSRTHAKAVRQSLAAALTYAARPSVALRTIDNPATIADAREGRCQRGDVIVDGWNKGLYVGRVGHVAVVFWELLHPSNERFVALCETFDLRFRSLRRKTGGTTHEAARKRAPHNGNDRECREVQRAES